MNEDEEDKHYNAILKASVAVYLKRREEVLTELLVDVARKNGIAVLHFEEAVMKARGIEEI